eukprot:9284624-Pyramimonas_sp.AAC.1
MRRSLFASAGRPGRASSGWPCGGEGSMGPAGSPRRPRAASSSSAPPRFASALKSSGLSSLGSGAPSKRVQMRRQLRRWGGRPRWVMLTGAGR